MTTLSTDRQFEIVSDFKPTGDQPAAIEKLTDGVAQRALHHQTLLGVTGSGKTFTMAGIIEKTQKPTLIIAHNKTLAAQLAAEFQEFFPNNSVQYFVSYYDYYQPEAYVPQSDTYIEKESDVNEEIDRLRHAATRSLLTRRDTIIVASVSCIYGLGSPEEYRAIVLNIKKGTEPGLRKVVRKLVDMYYERNDMEMTRGRFRLRGDTLEIMPAYEELAVRVQFFGDEVERITQLDPLTGEVLAEVDEIDIFPGKHFITPEEQFGEALKEIEDEMEQQLELFRDQGKLLEAERIEQRTRFDLEMLRETGTCAGIENYSRPLGRRPPGSAPWTLLDYFPDDYLIFIDESHITLPQIRGMFHGDLARKRTLVDFGFRLPSAIDNRPLSFEEFESRVNQIIYVSATPGPYEIAHEEQRVEQIIRPTGLIDPMIEIRPTEGQIDDLMHEITETTKLNQRVLVTTLTKRMAEELSDYLREMGVRVHYLHSEINTLERTEILRDLRLGVYDVVVGINLLREGLDLPEVSLVAILDADKEGLPALKHLAHPDHRPRRPPRRRSRRHVRRQGHRLDAQRHRRDRAQARDPGGAQRRERHRAADDRQRGQGHHSAGATGCRDQDSLRHGGGPAEGRHGAAGEGPREADEAGGEGAGVREGGHAARPGHGPAQSPRRNRRLILPRPGTRPRSPTRRRLR